MKTGLLAAVVFVCLAVVVACADGGEEEPPTEATETGIPTNEAELGEARAVAEQALLRLDDFPTGWVERPAEEEDEGFEPHLPPDCQSFIEQENLPGTLVEVDSPEFHGPDDEEVESGVTVFVDVAGARQAFAQVGDFIERCRQPLREAVTEYFQEWIREQGEDLPFEDIELTDFNLDRLSFPVYGDETMALRMSFAIDAGFLSFDFYADMFGIRVDRIIGGISFTALLERPDLNEEQRLAGIIEERLGTAVSRLK